jgi:hypothetical protein
LALKTTKQGYHVYKFGQHKHPAVNKPKSKWKNLINKYINKLIFLKKSKNQRPVAIRINNKEWKRRRGWRWRRRWSGRR